MDPDDPPASMVLRGFSPWQRAWTWRWCCDRWGPPAGQENPSGSWAWSDIAHLGTVLTLPAQEDLFELRLVRPWES